MKGELVIIIIQTDIFATITIIIVTIHIALDSGRVVLINS
jgi:hypothetical protein